METFSDSLAINRDSPPEPGPALWRHQDRDNLCAILETHLVDERDTSASVRRHLNLARRHHRRCRMAADVCSLADLKLARHDPHAAQRLS